MKDFDEDRTPREALDADERTFRLRGETFVIRAVVRPDALVPLSNVTPTSRWSDDLQHLDAVMLALLEPGQEDSYRAVRALEDDPVLYTDLEQIVAWAVEVSAGRPTGLPVASGNGHTTTADTSRGGSSLRVATPTG